MSQFEDELTEEIYITRFASGVPQHISVAAHEMLHVLIAAKSLRDVAVLGRILRWSNLPGRLGLQVNEKWHLLFAWSEEHGVSQLSLRRRSRA